MVVVRETTERTLLHKRGVLFSNFTHAGERTKSFSIVLVSFTVYLIPLNVLRYFFFLVIFLYLVSN